LNGVLEKCGLEMASGLKKAVLRETILAGFTGSPERHIGCVLMLPAMIVEANESCEMAKRKSNEKV
jgi:hypothetical protein